MVEMTQSGKKDNTGKILNVILVIAILVLCGLGFAYWQITRQPEIRELPGLLQEWTVLHERSKMDDSFAISIPASNTTEKLGFRLFGQTDIIEVAFGNGKIMLGNVINNRSIYEHESTLPESYDKITFVKSPADFSVFFDDVQAIGCALPRQNWRFCQLLAQNKPSDKPNISYQKIGNLYFSDNFMHGEGELGEWKVKSGNWSVHALNTPVRSANPFSFMGSGTDAEATTGFWFWRNYRFTTAVQPLDNGDFGLKINCTASKCYSLKWNHSTQKLALDANGAKAEAPLPLKAKNWYLIALESIGGIVSAYVDGSPILNVTTDSPLLGGPVAICTNNGAIFDDVTVEPTSTLALNGNAILSTTSCLDTHLKPIMPDGAVDLYTTTLQTAQFRQLELNDSIFNVTFDNLLNNYGFRLWTRNSGTEKLCFSFMRKDTSGEGTLFYFGNGVKKQLSQFKVPIEDGKPTFSLKAVGREVSVLYQGKTLAIAKVKHAWKGCACYEKTMLTEALTEEKHSGPELTSMECSAIAPMPGIDSRVEMFKYERSMQDWNSSVQEWRPSNAHADYWHRSDFWKDIAMEIECGIFHKNSDFGIVLGTQTATNNPIEALATLKYVQNEKLLLFKCGDITQKLNIADVAACRTLGLERIGDQILARVNGELAWNVPLQLTKGTLLLAGRIGKGNTTEWADAVTIRASNVHIDLFDKAPATWLPANGEWELTNRWQCDPRWSFFSGANMDGTACIWSKFIHGENVTIEYFAGPKMYYVNKKTYERAIDFNLILCADGQELTNGYNFMFGGRENMPISILKNNTPLADNKTMNIKRTEGQGIHHTWYHIKVRKHGNELAYWIDDKLAAVAKDKSPLADGRFALWTWKNGMMVAQMRCSSDSLALGGASLVPPTSTPRTPYDNK